MLRLTSLGGLDRLKMLRMEPLGVEGLGVEGLFGRSRDVRLGAS